MLRRACSAAVSRLSSTAALGGVGSSLFSRRYESLVIGDPSKGMIAPIHVSWTDIVGRDSGSASRISGGPLLAMLDMCAARCSQAAADQASRKTGERYLTCTVAVTNTMFALPILNGDAVRMDGRVVHCGGSSLGVYIRFFRLSPSTRMESAAGESFFTMVTITPDLKAAKIIPAMELTDPRDVALHRRYVNIRAIQKENEAETKERRKRTLTTDEVDCPINIAKPMRVKMGSTRTEANRIFFSACLNNNNTVFGGELMAWMEQHAVHCGRMFTGNRHMYTIGMHSVAFNEPVFATDWVTLEAYVIYVRNTTMEVDVQLRAERRDGAIVTNRASFVLINTNDIGMKAMILSGIDLTSASQEELQGFMEARARYHRSVKRADEYKENLSSAEGVL